MAVRVSAESGFDPGYVLKGQAAQGAAERAAGGYYINAAQAGEAPGRWFGKGPRRWGSAAARWWRRRHSWRSTNRFTR